MVINYVIANATFTPETLFGPGMVSYSSIFITNDNPKVDPFHCNEIFLQAMLWHINYKTCWTKVRYFDVFAIN